MKNLKITIIGCSVAVRIRPPEKYPNNKNYTAFLEEKLSALYPEHCIIIKNFGFSRATIWEISDRLETYLSTFPDYYILNIGVPDASTREIPYWFAQILRKPDRFLIKKIFSFIHSKFIKPFNPFFVKLRGKKTWVPLKEFEKEYDKILFAIHKETNAKAICLAINPANDRIESIIPGSRESYKKFNAIIEKLAKKYDDYYLNFDDWKDTEYFPDGIHYNLQGHKKVADLLANIIEKDYAGKN